MSAPVRNLGISRGDQDYSLSLFGFLIPEGPGNADCIAFGTMFKRWLKTQTHVIVSVSVPKDKERAVREAIKGAISGTRS